MSKSTNPPNKSIVLVRTVYLCELTSKLNGRTTQSHFVTLRDSEALAPGVKILEERREIFEIP